MLTLSFFINEWKNLFTGERTPLVKGGTRTQVLADNLAFTASALNHCTTYWFTLKLIKFSLFTPLAICLESYKTKSNRCLGNKNQNLGVNHKDSIQPTFKALIFILFYPVNCKLSVFNKV